MIDYENIVCACLKNKITKVENFISKHINKIINFNICIIENDDINLDFKVDGKNEEFTLSIKDIIGNDQQFVNEMIYNIFVVKLKSQLKILEKRKSRINEMLGENKIKSKKTKRKIKNINEDYLAKKPEFKKLFNVLNNIIIKKVE